MTKIAVDKELIEQAVEALRQCEFTTPPAQRTMVKEASTSLRAALAEPAVEPCARLHITATDTYPDVEVEVLNGELLQPEMSPVSVYAAPPPPAEPAAELVAHATVRPLQPDECERKVIVKWVNRPVPGPLYASPPPPTEVPLLENEVLGLMWRKAEREDDPWSPPTPLRFARAIEQAVRQKAGLK